MCRLPSSGIFSLSHQPSYQNKHAYLDDPIHLVCLKLKIHVCINVWIFLSLLTSAEYVLFSTTYLQFMCFICTSLQRALALVLGILLIMYLTFLLRRVIFLPKNMPSCHRNFLKVVVANK